MDEPSAWEDINPPMALVPRPEQRLPSSDVEPAPREHFRNELTACLALVVPSGMSEESRREWLAVAWNTLKHLPADLLSQGCRIARETCDHPSKIVPAIVAATEAQLEARRDTQRNWSVPLPPPPKRPLLDRRGEAMTQEETAELNTILKRLGAASRYRSDGSRYFVKEVERKSNVRPSPTVPTREDYISWGVDPAVLDKIDTAKT